MHCVMTSYCLDSDFPHIEGVTRRNCPRCRKVYSANYRKDNPNSDLHRYNATVKGTLKEWAKSVVFQEVRAKRIPRPDTLLCVDCGKQARCYDHRDYRSPLVIAPVCTACNRKRGPGLFGNQKRGTQLK